MSGLVTLSIDLGGGAYNITANTMPTNDSQWHYVTVSREALHMTLSVDNVSFVSTFTGLYTTLEVDPTMIYTGGYPGSQTIADDYYGCLQDIRLDSYPLPVVGSNQNSIVTSTVSVHLGCGPCSLDPCGVGSCSVTTEGVVLCTCPDGTISTTPCGPTSLPILGIYLGVFVGLVVLVASVALVSIMAWRCCRCRRRPKPLPPGYYSTKWEMDTLVPVDALVLSNDTGCGEEDTALDDHQSGAQGDLPILPAPTVEVPVSRPGSISPVQARSDSPVIHAVLWQLVEEHRLCYTDLDTVYPYKDESDFSLNGSLSSICSEMEKEACSIDWLETAGPQFKRIAPVLRHLLTSSEKNDAEMETNL